MTGADASTEPTPTVLTRRWRGATGEAPTPLPCDVAGGEFREVWVDKSLAALGFFTPSSRRIKREKAKTIRSSQTMDGRRIEVSALIVPSALYGLPITADQDKYLALQDVVRRQRHPGGVISNPVTFSSTAMLRSLGLCDSGRNHRDVREWLDLMASTTIISEGAVYLAGSRRWARDRFRVFERAVSRGRQLDDGSVADQHYVWLSGWQLENINSRYLLPVDLDVYRTLKTHIARALVLHLQIWRFASHHGGVFEKRYEDLCQLLGLRVYAHRSKILEKLSPALTELVACGFVTAWEIARTAEDHAFKLILRHGVPSEHPRQTPRRAMRPGCPTDARARRSPAAMDDTPMPTSEQVRMLIQSLVKRGVTPSRAAQLVAARQPNQDVQKQLEWGDFVIEQRSQGAFRNPAGFFVALVRDNVTPPSHFRSSGERVADDIQETTCAEERRRWTALRDAYRRFRDEEAAAHLASLPSEQRTQLVGAKAQTLRAQYTSFCWSDDKVRCVAEASLRLEFAARLPLPDFATFVRSRIPGTIGDAPSSFDGAGDV